MPTRFTILGSGAWGTAVGCLLANNSNHRVCLWSHRPELTAELQQRRENTRFLPGVKIPEAIDCESDIESAIDGADLCIAAVPTVYLRSTLQAARPQVPAHTPILSLCKGIENETFDRPSQILHELLGDRPIAVLSGPSHAEEVARGLPASVVVASRAEELAKRVQGWFCTDRFRVYTNTDMVGVELAGALKNVIAIAAGICDGLQFGDNTKAALLTRGLVEMTRFGVANGAEAATYYGLAGMGDLITTCFSRHGRNRRVGERLANGECLSDILASTEMVAEGVYTAKSVYTKSLEMGLEMPITAEVYRVLYEDKPPRKAVEELMQRQPVPEQRT